MREDVLKQQPYGGTPPHVDQETSIAAAHEMLEVASTLRGAVYREIKQQGRVGLTDEEIGDSLELKGNTVRPRRRELYLLGVVKDSGRTRLTRSGRHAIVWVTVNHRETGL
jgi:hypothetical protein